MHDLVPDKDYPNADENEMQIQAKLYCNSGGCVCARRSYSNYQVNISSFSTGAILSLG